MPDGADESTNVEIRRWGEPAHVDGGSARQHFEIGEALGLMDFERAAKLSGSRFVVLSGALARLERALAAFMLDMHTTEFGYTETAPPLLVRDAAAFGTGNLPKFEEDLFHTADGYWLIPTAEMPLTNLVAGEILEEAALPLALHRLHALLPGRGRRRRQGHQRHAAPAPVLQGRAGERDPAGRLGGRARAHDRLC